MDDKLVTAKCLSQTPVDLAFRENLDACIKVHVVKTYTNHLISKFWYRLITLGSRGHFFLIVFLIDTDGGAKRRGEKK